MTPEPASPRGSDYAALSRQVRQSGLLGRRPRYYAWKITPGLPNAHRTLRAPTPTS